MVKAILQSISRELQRDHIVILSSIWWESSCFFLFLTMYNMDWAALKLPKLLYVPVGLFFYLVQDNYTSNISYSHAWEMVFLKSLLLYTLLRLMHKMNQMYQLMRIQLVFHPFVEKEKFILGCHILFKRLTVRSSFRTFDFCSWKILPYL